MSNFKKGQKVWETACYAKPVVCKCCGIQKYLTIKPRVRQVKVKNVFERMDGEGVEISMGKDSSGRESFTVLPVEMLFAERADAMRAAKKQAVKETQDNRLKYMLFKTANKRTRG